MVVCDYEPPSVWIVCVEVFDFGSEVVWSVFEVGSCFNFECALLSLVVLERNVWVDIVVAHCAVEPCVWSVTQYLFIDSVCEVSVFSGRSAFFADKEHCIVVGPNGDVLALDESIPPEVVYLFWREDTLAVESFGEVELDEDFLDGECGVWCGVAFELE